MLCTVSAAGAKQPFERQQTRGDKFVKSRLPTQESRVSVPQRKSLISGDAEGGEQVEAFVQQRLQAGGRRVCRVEQVVHLLAGRTQSRH